MGVSAQAEDQLFLLMSPTVYYILHVVSLITLAGFTFYAFAAPAESRKRVMMITGIASLVALIAGFGLVSKVYNNNFTQLWLGLKVISWLGLSSMAGLAYRRRNKAGLLMVISLALVVLAVYAVYAKPGVGM